MRTIVGVMAIFLVSGDLFLKAEPNTTINYLMEDNVTMFDYGMDRTEAQLKRSLNGWEPMISYDWDKNRLVIRVHETSLEHRDLALAKILVKEVFRNVRYNFGVDSNSGKLMYRDEKSSLLYINFTHNGFTKKAEPKNLGIELDAITEIRAIVLLKNEGDPKSIICVGPLVGSEILCGDPE